MTQTHQVRLPLLSALSAPVLAVLSAREVEVRLPAGAARAQLAVPLYAPEPGDEVLVIGDADGACYVVGVLASRGTLRLEKRSDGYALRAHDALELAAGRGGSITIDEGVTLAADTQVLEVSPTGVSVTARALDVIAEAAEVALGHASLRADRVDSTVDHMLQRARVLEVEAMRIVERARDTYREVEELAQVRAGRLRMTATDALSMVGRRALLKARETMKVRGERIHLA